MESVMPYLLRYSYVGLFALILACSFGFPFSKTLIILGSGILASREVGSLHVYMLTSLAGLVTADSIYFWGGYLGGRRVLKLRYFTKPKNLERYQAAESRFRRQGALAVFSARFTPFVRALVYVAAGMSRMSPVRFFAADVLSALVLVPASTLAGYFFSEKREVLVDTLSKVEALLAVVFLLVIAFLVFVPRRRKGR